MSIYKRPLRSDELIHHGVKGMRWGIRRYQNPDGSYTVAGRKRYGGPSVNILRDFNRSQEEIHKKGLNVKPGSKEWVALHKQEKALSNETFSGQRKIKQADPQAIVGAGKGPLSRLKVDTASKANLRLRRVDKNLKKYIKDYQTKGKEEANRLMSKRMRNTGYEYMVQTSDSELKDGTKYLNALIEVYGKNHTYRSMMDQVGEIDTYYKKRR